MASLSEEAAAAGNSQQELGADFVVHSDIPSSSKQFKNEEDSKEERKENKDSKEEKLKSTLLLSGAVLAVIGAVVAMVKKRKDA
ncbi:OLC1v1004627C1 [Oldenlandia corymbosa var. corymbosa]|uniref:OLC1v1004627C1 n=1 Tax=Oldenlandia corymbosa var. corymbosa TaxID=529605 RepID=A0AAV1DCQ9_OLDCO|nr:OLC1v1004627C1 [Oldenlandia corymbosa var. corymbosa]